MGREVKRVGQERLVVVDGGKDTIEGGLLGGLWRAPRDVATAYHPNTRALFRLPRVS